MPLYVKGEGGANVVLAWRDRDEEEGEARPSSSSSSSESGKRRRGGCDHEDDDNARLRRLLQGRVLRVRKKQKARRREDGGGGNGTDGTDANADADAAATTAAAASALDALIWAPLAGASASPAERDEAFAHRVLAPALGPLLQRGRRLLDDNDDGDDALLLRAAAAATGAPTTTSFPLPPELLPDATTPLTAQEMEEAAQGLFVVPLGAPPLCFELKPKSGARVKATTGAAAGEAAAATTTTEEEDAVRRRFPRFALHALLKQHEKKGRLRLRQQEEGASDGGGNGAAAAAETTTTPGPPLYDPRRLFDAAKMVYSSSSSSHPIASAAREVAALLERPSNNLRVFCGGGLAFGRRPGGGGNGDNGDNDDNGCSQRALAGVLIEPGAALERMAEEAKGAAGAPASSLPPPAAAAPPPRPLVAALVAAALLASGALPALLKLQEADEFRSPEAAARLHASLIGRMAARGALQASSSSSLSSPLSPSSRDLALMRAYGTAVTAKDASVMVTLEQVAVRVEDEGLVAALVDRRSSSSPGRLWPWPWPLDAEAAAALQSDRNRSDEPNSPRAVGLLLDPRERAWLVKKGLSSSPRPQQPHPPSGRRWLSAFAWRARVVDTDLKPAAKAAVHAELERRCLDHALERRGVDDEEGDETAKAAPSADRPCDDGDPFSSSSSLPPRLRRYAAEREAWSHLWVDEWRAWAERDVLG